MDLRLTLENSGESLDISTNKKVNIIFRNRYLMHDIYWGIFWNKVKECNVNLYVRDYSGNLRCVNKYDSEKESVYISRAYTFGDEKSTELDGMYLFYLNSDELFRNNYTDLKNFNLIHCRYDYSKEKVYYLSDFDCETYVKEHIKDMEYFYKMYDKIKMLIKYETGSAARDNVYKFIYLLMHGSFKIGVSLNIAKLFYHITKSGVYAINDTDLSVSSFFTLMERIKDASSFNEVKDLVYFRLNEMIEIKLPKVIRDNSDIIILLGRKQIRIKNFENSAFSLFKVNSSYALLTSKCIGTDFALFNMRNGYFISTSKYDIGIELREGE